MSKPRKKIFSKKGRTTRKKFPNYKTWCRFNGANWNDSSNWNNYVISERELFNEKNQII